MSEPDKTDASYLALIMLRWERQRYELDQTEQEIRELVLALGKTQTVGNVRASYSAGRKTYDYEGAASEWRGFYPETWAAHMKVSYDYRAVCADLGLKDIPFTESRPTVSLKVLA